MSKDLSKNQQRRLMVTGAVAPMLTARGVGTKPPEVEDLIRLAGWVIDGEDDPLYPFLSGDTIVLGPEIFASTDNEVICWKGTNYTIQQEEGTD